ncbi:type IV pilus twitching motility protein PilT [candidate division KSB1 bacterium]
MNSKELLRIAVERGASDIHIKVGKPPIFRIDGQLAVQEDLLGPISGQIMEVILKSLLNPAQIKIFENTGDVDSAYSLPGVSRFRLNFFRQRGSPAAVIRVIKGNVPSLQELNLPEQLTKVLDVKQGMILVTGPTGSGKSSALAAMIDHINATKNVHVITIEDPVEFLHRDKKAAITQREVGLDTESFSSALKYALRQDPDIILVGEMRDPETIEIALRAAKTGHLVFSTLHTSDAVETINRVVETFAPEKQHQIRISLAENLQAVVSMKLLPRADGPGRVPAVEIMVVTAYITDRIINPEKEGDLRLYMESQRKQYGMQTFDQVLFDIYKQGLISRETAKSSANSPDNFELRLSGVQNESGGGAEPDMGGPDDDLMADMV